MKKFLKRHKSKLLTLAWVKIAGITLFLGYFGVSLLENFHLGYIRSKARNVVSILNQNGGGGTGFVVKGKSGKTYFLTNNHVCKSGRNQPMIALYRTDMYVVWPYKSFYRNDLCALEAPSTVTDYFSLAGTHKPGERVYTIGHPLLEPDTVTQGELSAKLQITITEGVNPEPGTCTGETYEEVFPDNPFLIFFGVNSFCIRHLQAYSSTVSILPGNSGSPTVNMYGNVVGVAFAAVESGVHSYHVPLEDIREFLDTL